MRIIVVTLVLAVLGADAALAQSNLEMQRREREAEKAYDRWWRHREHYDKQRRWGPADVPTKRRCRYYRQFKSVICSVD